MITIYHNTRCKKSREGLQLVENSGKEFQVREYLKEPLSEKELKALLTKLNMTAIQLVRKNEKIWKENFKDKDLSENELVRIMVENPKLIERPIVENETKAVVGRPPEEINNLV
ncbi:MULTISPECIES: arsenate reductase (glutaredoxin) [Zunongwangia]|jgi:arsenate reductase|uniref:arsenate reductase (glutaredoxin) n=1 Tax=Zunongwangia TaxID=417127 RepID=UPI000C8CEEE5|nr:arsenate reductase (glutaredoxin) [Zunongwangia profunda]MAG87114.1 arsenate reductase (glutaredoxin) [Flavobacteriaceae bacterium]MCC4227572.1 arsenate reductase (glutaredoxin) [Zunongwangia profunda]|tara:strand:- start:1541 stop:1882 length:342 start_codon:yes stop_codon:yes gene_type:complete